jgi:hypothetical protein
MTRVRARIAVTAALLIMAVPGAGLAQVQAAAGSAGGWIIDGDQLHTLYTDVPSLATANFSTEATDVFETPSGTAGIQPGWTSTRTSHFTRYESCDGATNCTSLVDDINDGVALPPVALYDDEVWSKTRLPNGSAITQPMLRRYVAGREDFHPASILCARH